MFKELMTMPHVIFGVLGIIAAVWVAVEALNISEGNKGRLKIASVLSTTFVWLAYLFGGWWYVVYYGAKDVGDKFIIKDGPWKWAHNFFMEAKEHVFFIIVLLSIYLVFVSYSEKLLTNKSVRKLIIAVAILIAILGFGMEGMGAMITKGIKMGLLGGK